MKKRLLTAAIAAVTVSLAFTGCAGGPATEARAAAARSRTSPSSPRASSTSSGRPSRPAPSRPPRSSTSRSPSRARDTEADVDQQIQMLQTALDKSPDAIGFAALDSQAAGPLLQQAKDAGIPVIAFDSGVDSDIPLTTASTDNLAAAAEAAKHMAELIGHEGKIALVVHDQTSVTGQSSVATASSSTWRRTSRTSRSSTSSTAAATRPSRPTSRRRSSRPTPTSRASTARTRDPAIGVVQAVKELGTRLVDAS